MKNGKCGVVVGVVLVFAMVAGLSGCSTLDRAYRQEVTWTNAPVVTVMTNEVVVTRSVAGPAGAGVVTEVVTNFVPVFYTNVVHVPVTNLVARPEALTAIGAAGAGIGAP